LSPVVPFSRVTQLSLKEAAIGYARMGWRVHPLVNKGKKPLLKGWQKQATTSEETISKWWLRWPNANIGITTGEKSGVFAVDIDPGHGGKESLNNLFDEHGRFENTACQRTGSGKHYLFRCDGPVKTRTNAPAPGIDIRGNGGYIVAAPSIHANGNLYRWEVDPSNLLNAPQWLTDLLEQQKKTATINRTATITEGGRNETLFSIACSMRNEGVKAIEISAKIFEINQYQCIPPLPDREVNEIISNANQYAKGNRKPLFQFREFVCTETCKDPALRHILHVVSFYMDVDGKPAYPTEAQLAERTGYARETVSRKLTLAASEGYIIRKKHKPEGQRYFNYVYMLPNRFACDSEQPTSASKSH
jgi:hypothetical protein